VLLHPDDALNVLYPGRTSIEFSYHRATLAIYNLPCNGRSNVLHHALRGYGMKFIGLLNNSSIDIHLYTDKEINEEVALHLRARRDKIIEQIEKNTCR